MNLDFVYISILSSYNYSVQKNRLSLGIIVKFVDEFTLIYPKAQIYTSLTKHPLFHFRNIS